MTTATETPVDSLADTLLQEDDGAFFKRLARELHRVRGEGTWRVCHAEVGALVVGRQLLRRFHQLSPAEQDRLRGQAAEAAAAIAKAETEVWTAWAGNPLDREFARRSERAAWKRARKSEAFGVLREAGFPKLADEQIKVLRGWVLAEDD